MLFRSNLTGSEKTSTGPMMPQVTASQDKNGNVTVNVQENMRNPFTPVGSGIKSDVNMTVNQDATHADINGTISGSPSFEANFSVNGGQNQNVPIQSEPTGSNDVTGAINFGAGLQKTNDVNKSVDLEKKKEEPQ